MDIKSIKKLVLFRFRDYYNEAKIREIINREFVNIKDNYSNESNISEDIYCSMLIENKIFCELLQSQEEEDIKYIKNICKKVTELILLKKENMSDGIEYLKSDQEVYEFCKKNYDGSESFIPYAGKYINGYYNGFDDLMSQEERKRSVEIENEQIESLKNMQKLEKKLKFKF